MESALTESVRNAFLEVVQSVRGFSHALMGFWTSYRVNRTFELEYRLVESARMLDASLLAWDAVSSILPRPTRHAVRALRTAERLFRLCMERWGTGRFLGPDGSGLIKEALANHVRAQEIPYLEAMLSWRSGIDMEQHRFADEEADRAEGLGLVPTMSPEEGKAVVWTLQKRWLNDLALFDTLPEFNPEDRSALNDAIDALSDYARDLTEEAEQARVEPSSAAESARDGEDEEGAETRLRIDTERQPVPKPKKPSVANQAMAVAFEWVKQGKGLNITEIARIVGCDRADLHKQKPFMDFVRLQRGNAPPKGRKDRESGRIEAEWKND